MVKEITPKGLLSESEIAALKARHGRVYIVTAEDDEGQAYAAYFKRPDMATLAAMTKLAKTDDIQAGRVLVENCFLAGADDLKTDPALFVATVAQLGKMVSSVRAQIKNA